MSTASINVSNFNKRSLLPKRLSVLKIVEPKLGIILSFLKIWGLQSNDFYEAMFLICPDCILLFQSNLILIQSDSNLILVYNIMLKHRTINSQSHCSSIENTQQSKSSPVPTPKNQTIEEASRLPEINNNKSIVYIKFSRKKISIEEKLRISLYDNKMQRAFGKKLSTRSIRDQQQPENTSNSMRGIQLSNEKDLFTIQEGNSCMMKEKQETIKEKQLPSIARKFNLQYNNILLDECNYSEEVNWRLFKQRELELNRKLHHDRIKMIHQKKLNKIKCKINSIEKPSEQKMTKAILDHLNRYEKRDFFQTKLNAFQTTIYPLRQKKVEKRAFFPQTVKNSPTLNSFNHDYDPSTEHLLRKRSHIPIQSIKVSPSPYQTFKGRTSVEQHFQNSSFTPWDTFNEH